MNQILLPKSVYRALATMAIFSLLTSSLPLGVYTAWAEEVEASAETAPAEEVETEDDETESADESEANEEVEVIEDTDDIEDDISNEENLEDEVADTEEVSEESSESEEDTSASSTEEKGVISTVVEKVGEVVKKTVDTLFGENTEITLTMGADGIATVNVVEVGKTYVAPQNPQVKVTFTEILGVPGSLSIEEVVLTDEQVAVLGLSSNVAYDITSDMENGTFAYDLELPKPEGAEDAKVIYADSVEALGDEIVEVVASEQVAVSSDVVSVTELNHFTIFVVVPNDIISDPLAYVPLIQGWRTESSGNANIGLVAATDFGIPSDFGSHVIKMDRAGGPGTNRAFLGYYEDGLKLKDIEEIKWNIYSKEGDDTYLNIYLGKNPIELFGFKFYLQTASVVFVPDTTQNQWSEKSLSSASSIQVRHSSNPTFSSLADLMASQYKDWDVRIDDSAKAGIVIVSGSSNPQQPQEHYVDGVTLKINGEEKHFNFAGTEYYDIVGVPSPLTPTNGETFDASDFPVSQTWTTVDSAVNYVYESYKDANPEVDSGALPVYIATTTVPNRNIGSVGNPPSQGEGTYYWRVKAVNEYGHESDWSEVSSFNFINHPDPLGQHQLNVSGSVYRDLKLDDCVGMTSCYNQGENLSNGWTINLYESDVNGDWQPKETKQTDASGIFNFSTIHEAGTYHVCIELKDGWTQQYQNWSGTPYHITTNNESGNTNEGPYCRVISYDDTADKSNKFYFGVVDTMAPVGNAVYQGGTMVNDIIYLKSVNDLSFTETITDNHGVVRATYLVQKLNTANNKFEGFCGNWNANSSGSHALGGSQSEVHTVSNIGSCVSNTSLWTDGTYKIFHGAYDATYATAGSTYNEGKFNANRQVFVIDNVAPAAPSILKPTPRQWFKSTPITTEWTASTDDTSGINGYQVAYSYDDGHSFGGSTCTDVTEIEGKAVSGCRDADGTTRGHVPGNGEQGGVTIWVRAIDNAGNASPWSQSVHYHFDSIAPETTLVVPTDTIGKIFTVSGKATDNLSLNRVYVQLVHRQTSQRYGGTTIHLSGTEQDWSKEFNATNLGLPEGDYAAHVSVVDNAGNTSSVGWSNNFSLDLTAPNVQITFPSNSDPVSGTVALRGTIEDDNLWRYFYSVPGVSKTIYADNGFVNQVFYTWDTTSLPDGVYTIKLEARDKANNKDSGSVSTITVTVDNVNDSAPTVLDIPGLLSPANGATIGDNTPSLDWNPINYSGTSVVSYEIELSANAEFTDLIPNTNHFFEYTSADFPGNTDPLEDGTYYWRVRACEGSVHPAPVCSNWVVWSFVVDTEGPLAPINLTWTASSSQAVIPNEGTTSEQFGGIAWEAADSDSVTYNLYTWNEIPDAPFFGTTPVMVLSGLTDTVFPYGDLGFGEGVYHACVTAVDESGNESACSETYTITLDQSPDTEADAPTSRSSSSGGFAAFASTGPIAQVLGASTDGNFCTDPYLSANLGIGLLNLAPEVIKLQNFLNTHMNAALPVTGIFGELTRQAVMGFQSRYASDILAPWGISTPTGMVYHTTKKKINEMACDFQKEFPLTQEQIDDINSRQGQTTGTVGQTIPSAPAAIVAGASTTNDEPEVEEDTIEETTPSTPAETPKPGFFKKIWNSIFGN